MPILRTCHVWHAGGDPLIPLAARPFAIRRFQEALTTESVGRFFVYRQVVDTTMVIARREADDGAPHGTLVLAEEQTAGRGRRGRTFVSPPGENLYFTMVLKLPMEQHRRLPVILPLAVATACQESGLEMARIKWPNDVWVGERKLSGMLIDAEVGSGTPIAFPGIGVNVNGDPTLNPELRDIATSFRRELGRAVERETLLARICNGIEENLAMPMGELLDRYRVHSMILGREILVTPPGGQPYEAKAEEIMQDGVLRVTIAGGVSRLLSAEDVSIRPA